MSDEHAHDISQHVRGYFIVGGALFLGTALTVMASYIDMGAHWMNITVALIIAIVKASLVALYFMHLISEKTTIYLVLGFTFFFFAGMMALTIIAHHDVPIPPVHVS